MNTKITTFIFDCFGVVCSDVLWNWYGENIEKKGFVDENLKNIFKEFDLGRLSEDDILKYFLKYEGINSSKEKLQEEIDSYLKIDRKLIDVIKEIKSRGFKTVLLSNANAAFFKRKVFVVYPEFKNLFDEIIISSEIGMVKPDKEIFLYALNKINSKPEETLFIDDSKKNIDSASMLGINGLLYTDSNSFSNCIKNFGIDLNNK